MKRAWLVAAAVAVPHVAHAERVTVTVVEVAGDVAYATPGKAAGVAAGDTVTLRSAQRVVLEVTEDTIAIKLDGLVVAIGATGSVETASRAQVAGGTTGPLRAEPFAGEWPEVVTPAQTQEPTPVPLGSRRAPGRAHVTLVGAGYGAASKDRHTGEAEARLIASWEPLGDRPLAADLDITGRVFSDGYDKRLRVPVLVRAAQLRYGSANDPRFALGRLRFAAASVGMLDGARGAMRLGAIQIGAYGGVVPDPVSGKPETSASRFGAQASYDLEAHPWRPRIDVVASGSTWSGELDERRFTVDASAMHGPLWLAGWAQADGFPSGNPWGARAVELSGAGASAEWRVINKHVGLDLDFLRPERSLRLAAVLPREWLCTQTPQAGDVVDESCGGGDYWTTATVSAGARRGRFSVDAYGSLGRSHQIATTFDRSGYVRGEMQLGAHRVSLGVAAGKTGFASWDSGEVGIATTMLRPLDLGVRYRAEVLDYVASTGPELLHTVGADVRYPRSAAIDLYLSAIGTAGSDRTVLAMLTTLVWRPLP